MDCFVCDLLVCGPSESVIVWMIYRDCMMRRDERVGLRLLREKEIESLTDLVIDDVLFEKVSVSVIQSLFVSVRVVLAVYSFEIEKESDYGNKIEVVAAHEGQSSVERDCVNMIHVVDLVLEV